MKRLISAVLCIAVLAGCSVKVESDPTPSAAASTAAAMPTASAAADEQASTAAGVIVEEDMSTVTIRAGGDFTKQKADGFTSDKPFARGDFVYFTTSDDGKTVESASVETATLSVTGKIKAEDDASITITSDADGTDMVFTKDTAHLVEDDGLTAGSAVKVNYTSYNGVNTAFAVLSVS